MYLRNVRPGVQGQRKFAVDKLPSPESDGFISGKFLMTKDKDHIFVQYTVLAMVHMINTMETSY